MANRTRKRYISPSTLKSMQNPIDYILRRSLYVMPRTEPVVSATASLHQTMESAFKSIIRHQQEFKLKGKMPGAEQVQKILDAVIRKARYDLSLGKSKSPLREFSFVKDMIRYYGGEILTDPNVTAFVETPMTSERYSSTYTVRAVPDLMIVRNLREEAGKKIADSVKVIDWKGFADRYYTKFHSLYTDPQKTTLKALAGEVFNTENVEFVFAINREMLDILAEKDPEVKAQMRRMFQAKIGNEVLKGALLNRFVDENLDNDRDLLKASVTQAELLIQMARDASRTRRGTRSFADIIESLNSEIFGGICGRNCSACVLHEICPYSDFISMITEYPLNGEKWESIYGSKAAKILSTEEFADLTKRYRHRFGVASVDWYKSIRELRKTHPTIHEAMINSMRANREFSMSEFMRRTVYTPTSLPPLLPFKITDTTIDMGHLDKSAKIALEAETRSFLEYYAKTVGLGSDSTREFVSVSLDKVLRDRKIAANLYKDMFQNAAKKALEQNIILGELPVERRVEFIKDAANSFTTETVMNFFNNISEDVTDIVREMSGEEKLLRKLGNSNTRKLLEEKRLLNILSPEERKTYYARVESFAKRMKSATIRAPFVYEGLFTIPMFPLSSIAASSVLIWALNHISYAHQLRQAAQRAIGTAKLQKKESIEALPHYSSYQTVRRLLLSDMGSAIRTGVLKPGRLLSEILVNVKEYYAGWKDALTRALSVIKTNLPALAKSISLSVDDRISSIDIEHAITAKPFKVGLGIGAVVALAPLIAKDVYRERSALKEKTEERRRQLKKIRETSSYPYSQIRAPESKLREGYKLHTNFGSISIRSIEDVSFKAFQYIKPTAEGILKLLGEWKNRWVRFSETRNEVTDLLIKKRQGIAEAATLRHLGASPETVLKKEMSDAISDITHSITSGELNRIQRKNIMRLKSLQPKVDTEKLIAGGKEAIKRSVVIPKFTKKSKIIPYVHPRANAPKPQPKFIKNFRDTIKSLVKQRLPYVRTRSITPVSSTVVDNGSGISKLIDSADLLSDVTHILTKRKEQSHPYYPAIRLKHRKAGDYRIATLSQASGMSENTADMIERASKVEHKKLQRMDVFVGLQRKQDSLQSKNTDLAKHISETITKQTKSLARNYSYGGYHVGRYHRLLFGG